MVQSSWRSSLLKPCVRSRAINSSCRSSSSESNIWLSESVKVCSAMSLSAISSHIDSFQGLPPLLCRDIALKVARLSDRGCARQLFTSSLNRLSPGILRESSPSSGGTNGARSGFAPAVLSVYAWSCVLAAVRDAARHFPPVLALIVQAARHLKCPAYCPTPDANRCAAFRPGLGYQRQRQRTQLRAPVRVLRSTCGSRLLNKNVESG